MGSRFHHTMHDFPRLLLNASMAMGTPLAVAQLLEVAPQLVYRWMAELEQPSAAHLGASRARLERALNNAPRFAMPHPRRRATDLRTIPRSTIR